VGISKSFGKKVSQSDDLHDFPVSFILIRIILALYSKFRNFDPLFGHLKAFNESFIHQLYLELPAWVA
jgi:hypothetical protein